MKIGIFGGAFNPIHNGHLSMAKYFYEYLSLDKLVFVPTAVPPHKSACSFVDDAHRLNMTKLAIEGKNNFSVSDIEFSMQGKSYTYNTLCAFKEKYPNSELYLIIGADQFLSFDTWYRYDDILDMASICTSPRENGQRKLLLNYGKSLDCIHKCKYYISDADAIEISSSQIRIWISHGKSVEKYLPEKVYKYIKEKGLYSV